MALKHRARIAELKARIAVLEAENEQLKGQLAVPETAAQKAYKAEKASKQVKPVKS